MRSRKRLPNVFRAKPSASGFAGKKDEEGSGYGALCKQSEVERAFSDVGQAKKSARGMPWHQEPKKDVTSCDKSRGAAHKRRSANFRMGKPGRAILCHRAVNKIAV